MMDLRPTSPVRDNQRGFLNSKDADRLNWRGQAAFSGGRWTEAETCFRHLAVTTGAPAAHGNLAIVLNKLGHPEEAIRHFEVAIKADPNNAELHLGLAHSLLISGDLPAGFRELEWRWKLPNRFRAIPARRWLGQQLNGRAVVVHDEGGFGDTLMMARYLPKIADRGGVPYFVGPPSLSRLIEYLPGVHVVTTERDLPDGFLECPMMSLPLAFETTLETIPGAPYLAGDPTGFPDIQALPGLRVGLCWDDAKSPGNAAEKPLRCTDFNAILSVRGCSFVSLKDSATRPLGDVFSSYSNWYDDARSSQRLYDTSGRIKDCADTAGMIAALDLVVTVDTAVAHLAGAMGKPVWLLNRYDSDWRWLLGRDDSPWYPSMRQFRQTKPGNWNSVIGLVCGALMEAANAGRNAEPAGAGAVDCVVMDTAEGRYAVPTASQGGAP